MGNGLPPLTDEFVIYFVMFIVDFNVSRVSAD